MRRSLRTFETLLALSAAYALVFLLPFRVLAAIMGTSAPGQVHGGEPHGAAVGLGLGRRVERLAHRLPVRTTCLVRAVALWLLLRRRGLTACVRLGVRRSAGAIEGLNESAGKGGLEAHAWVEIGGVPVLGAQEATGFTPIADLGAPDAAPRARTAP